MYDLVRIKFGAHLFGTSTSDSDLDIKSVYIPTSSDILLGRIKKTIQTGRVKGDKEQNTKDDVDVESFSVCRFIQLLMDGQTVALDAIFAKSDNWLITPDPTWIYLQENKHRLITKNVNAFVGYTKQQAARYGVKGSRMDSLKRAMDTLQALPHHAHKLLMYEDKIRELVVSTKELISLEKTPLIDIVLLKGPTGLMDSPHISINGRNIPFHATVKYAINIVGKMLDGYGQRANKAHLAGGKDWKALSHAVRIAGEAVELLNTGNITFPRPDREMLLNIKLGNVEYEKVADMIEQGLVDLYQANKTSTLRETPDIEWAEGFVYSMYLTVVSRSTLL